MRRLAPPLVLAVTMVAALSLALGLAGCGGGRTTFSETNLPGPSWRPYSDASPFNRPIHSSPRLAANSQQIVDRWLSFWSGGTSSAPTFSVGTAGTAHDWDHPVYFSQPTDPTYTVHCTQPGTCAVEGKQVHIPAEARPAAGSDGHLAVIDQRSGWEYDFWQVRQKSGGILKASWGGRTRIDGNGLGASATASGFGLAAGLIRPSELAAGNINHALFMVVRCTNGTAVWPAGPANAGRKCSELGLPNTSAPAMGQHFYLEMTDAQIDALKDPPWQKTILRAMAHYGLYVGDTGGGFLKLESGSSYTSLGYQDPWPKLGKRFRVPTLDTGNGGLKYSFDLRGAVNWKTKLKVAAAGFRP